MGWVMTFDGMKRESTGKERRRNKDLLKKYGITVDTYNVMLEEQGGKCIVCERGNKSWGGTSIALCVDHRHSDGLVRGLLCNECNHGVMLFRDSSAFVRRASKYVCELHLDELTMSKGPAKCWICSERKITRVKEGLCGYCCNGLDWFHYDAWRLDRIADYLERYGC